MDEQFIHDIQKAFHELVYQIHHEKQEDDGGTVNRSELALLEDEYENTRIMMENLGIPFS